MGLEFKVNTVFSGDQQDPAVGRQPGGGFLVAWESDDANNTGIFAQVFDTNGDDVGQDDSGMAPREWRELMELIGR